MLSLRDLELTHLEVTSPSLYKPECWQRIASCTTIKHLSLLFVMVKPPQALGKITGRIGILELLSSLQLSSFKFQKAGPINNNPIYPLNASTWKSFFQGQSQLEELTLSDRTMALGMTISDDTFTPTYFPKLKKLILQNDPLKLTPALGRRLATLRSLQSLELDSPKGFLIRNAEYKSILSTLAENKTGITSLRLKTPNWEPLNDIQKIKSLKHIIMLYALDEPTVVDTFAAMKKILSSSYSLPNLLTVTLVNTYWPINSYGQYLESFLRSTSKKNIKVQIHLRKVLLTNEIPNQQEFFQRLHKQYPERLRFIVPNNYAAKRLKSYYNR